MKIGFCGSLLLIFIVLKLVGVISWPWIWVLAPGWIGAIIILAYIVLKVILDD